MLLLLNALPYSQWGHQRDLLVPSMRYMVGWLAGTLFRAVGAHLHVTK